MNGDAPALTLARPAFLDETGLQAVLAALPSARLVGGAVRDAVAGLAVADIDLGVPEPPDRVIAALDRAGLKHAPTGLQHGTVTAVSGGRGFEVTTLRTDERTDGRHAEVAWTTDWRQDAARRDFTINAMSMRPADGAVFDYFGGLADLAAGRVRFVGDPARRIAEDTLRVMRFFRFQARYGRAAPEAETIRALAEAAPMLARLSVERVWSELKRILAIPDPVAALTMMAELDILGTVLPGPVQPARVGRLVAAGAPADPLLRLLAFYPSAPQLAERLKLSRQEVAILAAFAGPPPDPSLEGAAMRRALADTSAETLIGRSWLSGGNDPAHSALRERIAATARPVFPLHGRDALAAGVPPGPEVGALIAAVRAWWMDGGCVADAAACRSELAAKRAAELARRSPR